MWEESFCDLTEWTTSFTLYFVVSFYRIYLHIFVSLVWLVVQEGASRIFMYWKWQWMVGFPVWVSAVCSIKRSLAFLRQALKWELNPCHAGWWISAPVGSLQRKYLMCTWPLNVFVKPELALKFPQMLFKASVIPRCVPYKGYVRIEHKWLISFP